jgi:hypothetical protein
LFSVLAGILANCVWKIPSSRKRSTPYLTSAAYKWLAAQSEVVRAFLKLLT